MKKLFSLFSMLILLSSNALPAFTYADSGDNELAIQILTEEVNNVGELFTSGNEYNSEFIEVNDASTFSTNSSNPHIVHDEENGLITVYTGDFSYGITIRDKNEGATELLGTGNYYRWAEATCSSNDFHVPTHEEWQDLVNLYNSINDIDNKNFGIDLKMPFASFLYNNNLTETVVGKFGYYQSSSNVDKYGNSYGWALAIGKENGLANPDVASYGKSTHSLSLRCFKNDYVLYPKTVTFNPNGGAFSGMDVNETTGYTYQYSGSEIIPIYNIQIPNRESEDISQQSGWMFDGWYTMSGENNNWGEEFDISNPQSTTAYAKWLPFNDFDLGIIGLTGIKIMDRNLGALMTGAGTDASTGSYGYYYQWGNNYGFKDIENIYPSNTGNNIMSNPNHLTNPRGPNNYYYNNEFIINKSKSGRRDEEGNKNLWGGESHENPDTFKQGPCPEGYHIPDSEERESIRSAMNRVKSRECIGEISDLGICITSKLKLPMAGNRGTYNNGKLEYQGVAGYYWSSSPYLYVNEEYIQNYSYSIVFNKTQIIGGQEDRNVGYSIRCFKNSELKKLTISQENGDDVRTENYRWWENIGKYLPKIIYKGYNLLGWYYDLNDINSINETDNVLEDKTIYAKWEKNPRYYFKFMNGPKDEDEKILKYEKFVITSHTDNLDDNGNTLQSNYNNKTYDKQEIIHITGATSLNVKLKYYGNKVNGTNDSDYLLIWTGKNSNYSNVLNSGNAIKIYSGRNNSNYEIFTITGDSITVGFKSYENTYGPGFGYHIIVEGYGYYDNNINYTPRYLGHEFLGWYEGNSEIPFDFENTPVTEDKTLYAHWKSLKQKTEETTTENVVYTNTTTVTVGNEPTEEVLSGSTILTLVSKEVEDKDVKKEEDTTKVQESEIKVTSDKTVEYEGGLEVYLEKTEDTGTEVKTGKVEGTIKFSAPVAVKIPISSETEYVKVQVKHGDEDFGFKGLTLNPVNECNNGEAVNDKYQGEDIEVKSNNGDKYATIYTCSASTFVAYTENKKPIEPQPSAGGGRTIVSTKNEIKTLDQEHNSANLEKTTVKENTEAVNKTVDTQLVEGKVKKIEGRSLTRGEVAVMTNILLDVYPQLTENRELNEVSEACESYADGQNFTKDEKKAITRLCKLSIMGIHSDDNRPLEEFLVNNGSTNDEFSKVINRSLSTYTEKDFSAVKEALKKLEGDEENVVFGTVYDMFMGIKNIFSK